MKNILVTGGAGYIGSHMVYKLIQSGYNPIVIDNFSKSDITNIKTIEKLTSKFSFIKADIRDDLDSLDIPKIDAVVHFAAFKSVGESTENPLLYYDNNVTGSINLLKWMTKRDIRHIVFSSTCAVYGDSEKPVEEDTELSPKSPYGQSKLMVEQILGSLVKANKLDAVILRYFNVAGNLEEGQIGDLDPNPQTLIPSIMLSSLGLKKFSFQVFGDDYPTRDGTCIRDYIDVLDLVEGHLKALEFLQGNSGIHTFNLGSGTGTSVLEIINAFERVTQMKLKYQVANRRPGDVVSITANPHKAREVLNWQPKRNLDQMISSMWKWYKYNYPTS